MFEYKERENLLAELKPEIAELFFLVKPVTDPIVECQRTFVPTGQTALLGLATLKLTTLKVGSPLVVLSGRKFPRGATERIGGGERMAENTPM